MVADVTSNPRRRRSGSSWVRAAMRARSAQVIRVVGASLEYGELVAQDQDLDLLRPVDRASRTIQPTNLDDIR
jgi:hypothetical protein